MRGKKEPIPPHRRPLSCNDNNKTYYGALAKQKAPISSKEALLFRIEEKDYRLEPNQEA